MVKYLIVGLGNIGPEYDNTRHNIGFMILDALAQQQSVNFDIGKHALVAEFKHKGKHFYLAKPTTYMNLSGKAVVAALKEYHIFIENLLVVVDDLALPFGKIRIKPKGSSAGHNGLKHIEEMLGHQNYARMRLGIGNNYPKGKQIEYVLGKFSLQEQEQLPAIIERATRAILSFGLVGLEKTMTDFNN
ncbi:MAG: aminoacyl-tRNA hydrolase [Cytophagales bacterium]|nr:aminoacyl-tRNA hydrolase [Cytophagales bacterium]MDW8383568.1 aminoacyl-tRNA hydrolase [Flammeovirgaceae bacterium]